MLTCAFFMASVLLNNTTPADNSTWEDPTIPINVYKSKEMRMNVHVVRTIVFATLAITFAIIGGALLAHRCLGSDYIDMDTRRAADERRSEDRRALLAFP